MKKFILARMGEASTYRHLLGLLSLFGVAVSPEQSEAIAGVGIAVYMLWGAFTPDKKEPTP